MVTKKLTKIIRNTFLIGVSLYNINCSSDKIQIEYNPGFVREKQIIENVTEKRTMTPKITDMIDYDGKPGVDKVIISELYPVKKYKDENNKDRIFWERKPTKYFISKNANRLDLLHKKAFKKNPWIHFQNDINKIPYYRVYGESQLKNIKEIKNNSFFDEYTKKYNTIKNLENSLK